uniref:TIL domain-containing protein n=1 Tax=Ciona savignyi TaxID=51511 RepID=H2YB85_CIOSA
MGILCLLITVCTLLLFVKPTEGQCHECPPDSTCVGSDCVCNTGHYWNNPETKQSCIKMPPTTTAEYSTPPTVQKSTSLQKTTMNTIAVSEGKIKPEYTSAKQKQHATTARPSSTVSTQVVKKVNDAVEKTYFGFCSGQRSKCEMILAGIIIAVLVLLVVSTIFAVAVYRKGKTRRVLV